MQKNNLELRFQREFHLLGHLGGKYCVHVCRKRNSPKFPRCKIYFTSLKSSIVVTFCENPSTFWPPRGSQTVISSENVMPNAPPKVRTAERTQPPSTRIRGGFPEKCAIFPFDWNLDYRFSQQETCSGEFCSSVNTPPNGLICFLSKTSTVGPPDSLSGIPD